MNTGLSNLMQLNKALKQICSVYIKFKSTTENHKTTINQKHKNFTYNDLIRVAEKNGIKQAPKIIQEVIDSLLDWEKLANEHGVKEDYEEHVQSVIDDNITTLNIRHYHDQSYTKNQSHTNLYLRCDNHELEQTLSRLDLYYVQCLDLHLKL